LTASARFRFKPRITSSINNNRIFHDWVKQGCLILRVARAFLTQYCKRKAQFDL
jgi:hypothetical protein